MDLRKNKNSWSSKLPFFTSKQIVLPTEMILYMAKFLKFEDYRSFIQSLGPNSDESEIFEAKLWQLSTHKFTATFLNGHQLPIEYNFDASRIKEDRVLINVDYLLPVFGEVSPSVTDKFISIRKLYNFIRMHVNLNMCSGGRHSSCSCEANDYDDDEMFFMPTVERCRYFHHYCSQHIKYWLDFYLVPSVMLRETGKFFDEDTAGNFVFFLHNTIHPRG